MKSTPATRRDQILQAALACFLARGYDATTIADIRKLSGATTGSIYHAFSSKGDIALALLETAIAGWSATAPNTPNPSAEAAIKASVAGLLDWAEANTRLHAFMDEVRLLADSDADFAPLRQRLDAGQAAAAALYAGYVEQGLVRPLPWPVAHSLMLGPTYNYLRLARAGKSRADFAEARTLLIAAAWKAVSPAGR
jgi:AcrR family transcriptional regulator